MRQTTITGSSWVFGDDMNTDVIHAPDYFSLDEARVRLGLFQRLDPTIQQRIQPGDILIGGRNFGCGSSRETVIRSLKLNQVGAIVAIDFARIFFRSATNLGFPCLTFADPNDHARIVQGERLELRFDDWTLRREQGEAIALAPAGPFILDIWQAGGLLALIEPHHAS
jgi:3-isopropylmalate dehydratase small subunit